MTLPKPTVSTKWLADSLGADDLAVIDASWRLPGAEVHALTDFEKRHIPGATFFDIDAICDLASPLPHMLPGPDEFARAVGALGIGSDDRIVVYDDAGIFSAARVWWTFRAMGHEEIAVLDGGLGKWLAERRPVESAAPRRISRGVRAKPRGDLVRSAADVRAFLETGAGRVLDARPAGRFAGAESEPRPGLRSGHMPGAVSLPASEVLTAEGTLKDADALAALFAARGVGPDTPVITTCGSGVTAAILALALDRLGHSTHGLYDGSWTEWGDLRNDAALFPVATGEA